MFNFLWFVSTLSETTVTVLWNWRQCTHGRKPVAPWLLSGSKTKQERQACEESHAENQVRSPGTSHWQDCSSRGSLRLHYSSQTLLIFMSSIDCEQSLFCSEIRVEECNKESLTSVTTSVTCKWRVARAACGFPYRAYMLTTHRSQSMSSTKKFACDVRQQSLIFLVDLIVMNHF